MVICNSAAVRLPSPFRRFPRSSSASAKPRLSALALPPTFLAPSIYAQSFSLQSSHLAAVTSSRKPSSISARNPKGELKRLGQKSKWTPKPPPAGKKAGQKPLKAALPKRDQDQDRGFRLRAKALLDSLKKTIRDLGHQSPPSRAKSAQIETEIAKALTHFEAEMKALRVMIKSKDVLIDPENAWRSASRIKGPYNAAIRLCMQNGKSERAFKLFNQMKKDGIFPSAPTYTVLINGLTRTIVAPTSATSSDSEIQESPQHKTSQRVHEVYQDVEKLWKQAFPRYFQHAGLARCKDTMTLNKDDFHAMTEQSRRNLVSQQASIHEAREFPKVLTNAIGAYANFLRRIDSSDELAKLFDRLFPSTLIDGMADGLMPNASPQAKLELANRKLSDWLPLGDKTTISSFLPILDAHNPDRLVAMERVWTRLYKLMHLEQHEKHSSSSQANKKHQTSNSARTAAATDGGNDSQTECNSLRFVPDDQLMVETLSRLKPAQDADSPQAIQLGLSILQKVYGLDLVSAADGIVRDPELPGNLDAFGPEQYLDKEKNDFGVFGQSVTELRSPAVASLIFHLLAPSRVWKENVAFFNYLWAQHHARKYDNSLTSNVTDMLGETSVFGNMLQPSNAMRILWNYAQHGDPIGARVLLEAMKRAAQSASNQRFETHRATTIQAPHLKLAIQRSSHRLQASEWKPADLCYIRAMRANLQALLKKPHGLTASSLEEGGRYDAWAEAKALFGEWRDLKAADCDNTTQQTSNRRDADKYDALSHAIPARGSGRFLKDVKQNRLADMHAATMRSLLLSIARACAAKQGPEGVGIARDALRILNQGEGLEQLVSQTNQQLLQHELPTSNLTPSTETSAEAIKVNPYTLLSLGRIIALALDTSSQSFAAKADVELWKRIRKMLPAPSALHDAHPRLSSKQGPRLAHSTGLSREMLSRPVGGNRLLLSKDDYSELEAAAEEEELHHLGAESEHSHGSSYRMQRRSRHVEQELQRWVRGASL